MTPTSLSFLRRTFLLAASAAATLLVFAPPVLTQGPPAPRTTRINGYEAAIDEVLVKYRPVAQERVAAIERAASVNEAEAIGADRIRRVRSTRIGAVGLLRRLQVDPDVEYAEPNYVLRANRVPNDPSFTALWGLFNTGFNTVGGSGTAGDDIGAPTAWDTTTGSRANVVGVVDTGIDYTHPDLAANVWSAPRQFTVTIAGQAITCSAGTHGFNAINRTCNPMDDATTPHGTHVSGTIGATGNNGVGIVGVNWVASIMGLKFLGTNGSGLTSDAIAAINFAVQTKTAFASTSGANIRVLNNSWGGGGYTQALADVIASANNNQILFVASAGNSTNNNDTNPSYPGSYTTANVLTVASTTNVDGLSSFSNYGLTSVDLGAPGSSIYSTLSNNQYGGMSGTSMAAPHVSGAAALVLAMCSATTAELKGLLMNSVDQISALSSVTVTGGRLNVARAMQNCAKPMVTAATVTADKTAPQGTNTAITFTANATGGQAAYQYRWFIWDGTVWTAATNWVTSNTFTWTPTVVNSAYQVQVRVRSSWNTGGAEATGTKNFAIVPRVTSITQSADKAAPQGAGSTITWTATPVGGRAPYQYRWFIWDGSAWTAAGDWQASNVFAWTPSTANASYQVQVRVRGTWNTGNYEAQATTAYAIRPIITSATVTANKTAPQGVNTAVTFTASASGGTAPYQYRWFLWNGSTWTALTASWSTTTSYTWTPTVANSSYRVEARARSAWNIGTAEATANIDFAIRPVVTSVTVSANKVAPQAAGTTITFTATPTGGQAPYQYRWFLWNGTTWVALTNAFDTSNTYSWTPSSANASYQVQARVRSAWNTGVYESTGTRAFAIQ